MKKVKLIIGLTFLSLFMFVFLVLTFFIIKENQIGMFHLEDYSQMTEEFSSDVYLGEVTNAFEAKKYAEEIWISKYGAKVKWKNRPYQIFYDEKNRAWLIQGSFWGNSFGGVPNVIIREFDGKVLAVWHDK